MLILFRATPIKTINQQLIESISIRQLSYNFSIQMDRENMYLNNVKIIESINLKQTSLKVEDLKPEKESHNPTNNEPQSNTSLFKTKIDNIMQNYEKDREIKLDLINELNAKLVEQTSKYNFNLLSF